MFTSPNTLGFSDLWTGLQADIKEFAFNLFHAHSVSGSHWHNFVLNAYLVVLLQRPYELSIHLSCLGHSDRAPLCLPQPVLQDAAGFIGLGHRDDKADSVVLCVVGRGQ